MSELTREWDGKSEVPENMTPVKAKFRRLDALQLFLTPSDTAFNETAYLCIPPDEYSDNTLWYRYIHPDLLAVKGQVELDNLNAALKIFNERTAQ